MRTTILPRAAFRAFVALVACVLLGLPAAEQRLRSPSMSRDRIVFAYAGDLWTVARGGGDAIRLTSGPGEERNPYFSPNGNHIAFMGEYEGNTDVYVAPATGGTPQRLTHHPDADIVVGWSNDGRILFRSGRDSYNRFNRLFTVELEGGFPRAVPLPMAEEGSYSPDGKRLASVPLGRAFQAWKRHRGGRATPVWVANLADSSVVKMPRTGSNDFAPMWIGDTIYFLLPLGS